MTQNISEQYVFLICQNINFGVHTNILKFQLLLVTHSIILTFIKYISLNKLCFTIDSSES